MAEPLLDDSRWSALLRRLPAGLDLDVTARESLAFVRPRGVDSAEKLLRLALIYGATDLSLRSTAVWAETTGLASISDVALLGRLRGASDWLAVITSALMTASRAGGEEAGRRVRLVDATNISGPGHDPAQWRVHADYDLKRGRFIGFELTGKQEAERLSRFVPEAGDIFVGDRIYAQSAAALQTIRDGGADFLVRRGITSCRLLHSNGSAFDLPATLARVAYGKTIEMPVRVPLGKDGAEMRARLIVHHMPEEYARKARARAKANASWDAQDKRLTTAEYVLLLTSLPKRSFPADTLLALYRLRWQIELGFKRLKSLVGLDQLAAKNDRLVRTCLCAKLIVALLSEDLLSEVLDSPPWGARALDVRLATAADRARRPAQRHSRQRRARNSPQPPIAAPPRQKSRRAKTTTKTTGM